MFMRSADWAWSLPLILLTVVIHVFGLGLINERVVRALSRSMDRRRMVPLFALVMGVSVLLGGGKAAITGDFVLTASEVNPVLKALREHGIEVTAIHNHVLDDPPRLYFMHFWANEDAKKLAEGLKAALAHINVAKS